MFAYNRDMGHVTTGPVWCKECGGAIDESPHIAAADRRACRCGSTARLIEVMMVETVKIRSDLSLKQKRPGVKKPLSEQKHGDSFSVRFKRWMRRSRVIDRQGDRYTEAVVDPETGDVIHHCDEPLSEHRGHGSAKTARM